MRFLIELEGSVFDVAASYHAAHVAAADAVGWSRLDAPRFWRLLRIGGDQADLLPGAGETKRKEYSTCFARLVEGADSIAAFDVHDVAVALSAVSRCGAVAAITLGSNLEARRFAIDRFKLAPYFGEMVSLSSDPRRRPTELIALSQGDPRTIVAATSDAIIRSADQCGLFTVGLSCGSCGIDRLQRAGPRIMTKNLNEFARMLERDALELVRAGLLPHPHGT